MCQYANRNIGTLAYFQISYYRNDNKRISSRRQICLICRGRITGNGQWLCQSPYGDKTDAPERWRCLPGRCHLYAGRPGVCGSYQQSCPALSITSNINFFKAESKGFLYAEAREVFSHKRLANCEVNITNEAGELIATFSGSGYRKDTELPFAPIE